MRKAVAFLLAALSFLGGQALQAQATLTAAVGLALPPYVLKDTNNGLEVDIVRQALQEAGYTLKLDYVPFARIPISLKDKSVDCALTINEASGVTGVFYSQSHITYQNVVVALKSRDLKIAKVDDLKALRVVAFQDATNYLGNDFRAMAKANTGYSELANQEAQVKMLFMDRADVVVMDINIFKYFRQAIKDVKVDAEVTIYPIFPPTHYKVAFTSPEVCQKFNAAFNKLKAAGKVDAIFKTYIK